jgi:hypothetical protein
MPHIYACYTGLLCNHLKVSVAEDPATWWRYAIGAVLRECHKVRRPQAPLAALERRRKQRLQYQPLYAAVSSVYTGFLPLSFLTYLEKDTVAVLPQTGPILSSTDCKH